MSQYLRNRQLIKPTLLVPRKGQKTNLQKQDARETAILESILKSANASHEKTHDEYDIFGSLVAQKLRKLGAILSSDEVEDIQDDILEVFRKARKGRSNPCTSSLTHSNISIPSYNYGVMPGLLSSQMQSRAASSNFFSRNTEQFSDPHVMITKR